MRVAAADDGLLPGVGHRRLWASTSSSEPQNAPGTGTLLHHPCRRSENHRLQENIRVPMGRRVINKQRRFLGPSLMPRIMEHIY